MAAARELELALSTAPDRLARYYVHHVRLLEELEKNGCQVQVLDRPMSRDPYDQLLLQIRGAGCGGGRPKTRKRGEMFRAQSYTALGHAPDRARLLILAAWIENSWERPESCNNASVCTYLIIESR